MKDYYDFLLYPSKKDIIKETNIKNYLEFIDYKYPIVTIYYLKSIEMTL